MLALRRDGTVVAWGYNGAGQLGHGLDVIRELNFVDVAGLTNVIASAAGAIDGQLTIATNAPTAGTQIVTMAGTGVGDGSVSTLTLVGAVSRKLHAGTPFEVIIDRTKTITQAITTEPRTIGAGHQLILTFNQAITQPGTATVVDQNSASLGNIASIVAQGSTVIVTLTGIPDKQRATLTLSNVNNIAGNHPVLIGFLVGDVTNNGAVNAGDIAATKARINQPLGATTFRFDVNASGSITPQDVSVVKARAGVMLP